VIAQDDLVPGEAPVAELPTTTPARVRHDWGCRSWGSIFQAEPDVMVSFAMHELLGNTELGEA
jgi:hypothetical protein